MALKDVKEKVLLAKTVKTADSSSQMRRQKINNTNNQANSKDAIMIHANQEGGKQNHPGGPGLDLNGPK